MLQTLIGKTDPQNYDQYLKEKISNVVTLFKKNNLAIDNYSVFESPKEYYRMRTEFCIFFNEDRSDFNFCMFEPNTKPKKRIELHTFPVGSKAINKAMLLLKKYLLSYDELKHKLFQIDFLSNQSGEIIIALNYHKAINEIEFKKNISDIKSQFLNEGLKAQFIGRAKKQLILADTDTILETIHTKDRDFYLYQVEGNFSQPNIYACQNMVQFARDCCTDCKDVDLIELYCGSGTFTVCLADLFRKVMSTEVSRVPTNTALKNIEKNNIKNTKIARLSAVEVAQALNNVREFNRLKEADIDIHEYNFNTLLIDPPRSGLCDKEALDFTARFDRVIYISCNPETLVSDLTYLTKTHEIKRIAFFDQFPYTNHLESGILLEKK
ncbi:tRNA (uridine(54)-C5)-methyltransferase TrmA [Succinivibrio sp.]|uniref:tRNA (uridine(54)-C5)-methyltransferase TrmA n=2 Tax=Succinivibrio sp. TaxID=2053619 RepID=UPI00386F66FC